MIYFSFVVLIFYAWITFAIHFAFISITMMISLIRSLTLWFFVHFIFHIGKNHVCYSSVQFLGTSMNRVYRFLLLFIDSWASPKIRHVYMLQHRLTPDPGQHINIPVDWWLRTMPHLVSQNIPAKKNGTFQTRSIHWYSNKPGLQRCCGP